eukprot:gene21454-28423_t
MSYSQSYEKLARWRAASSAEEQVDAQGQGQLPRGGSLPATSQLPTGGHDPHCMGSLEDAPQADTSPTRPTFNTEVKHREPEASCEVYQTPAAGSTESSQLHPGQLEPQTSTKGTGPIVSKPALPKRKQVPLSSVLKSSSMDRLKLSAVEKFVTRLDAVPNQFLEAQVLYLSKNSLESLRGVEQFSAVHTLSLTDNLISDWAELDRLWEGCPGLTILSLEGNPLAQLPNYRPHVIERLPSVTSLDLKPVTNEERSQVTRLLNQEDACVSIMVHNACVVHKMSQVFLKLQLHLELVHVMYGPRHRQRMLGISPTSMPVNPEKLIALWDYEGGLSVAERQVIEGALRREVGRMHRMMRPVGKQSVPWEDAFSQVHDALSSMVQEHITGAEAVARLNEEEKRNERMQRNDREQLVQGLRNAFNTLSPGGRAASPARAHNNSEPDARSPQEGSALRPRSLSAEHKHRQPVPTASTTSTASKPLIAFGRRVDSAPASPTQSHTLSFGPLQTSPQAPKRPPSAHGQGPPHSSRSKSAEQYREGGRGPSYTDTGVSSRDVGRGLISGDAGGSTNMGGVKGILLTSKDTGCMHHERADLPEGGRHLGGGSNSSPNRAWRMSPTRSPNQSPGGPVRPLPSNGSTNVDPLPLYKRREAYHSRVPSRSSAVQAAAKLLGEAHPPQGGRSRTPNENPSLAASPELGCTGMQATAGTAGSHQDPHSNGKRHGLSMRSSQVSDTSPQYTQGGPPNKEDWARAGHQHQKWDGYRRDQTEGQCQEGDQGPRDQREGQHQSWDQPPRNPWRSGQPQAWDPGTQDQRGDHKSSAPAHPLAPQPHLTAAQDPALQYAPAASHPTPQNSRLLTQPLVPQQQQQLPSQAPHNSTLPPPSVATDSNLGWTAVTHPRTSDTGAYHQHTGHQQTHPHAAPYPAATHADTSPSDASYLYAAHQDPNPQTAPYTATAPHNTRDPATSQQRANFPDSYSEAAHHHAQPAHHQAPYTHPQDTVQQSHDQAVLHDEENDTAPMQGGGFPPNALISASALQELRQRTTELKGAVAEQQHGISGHVSQPRSSCSSRLHSDPQGPLQHPPPRHSDPQGTHHYAPPQHNKAPRTSVDALDIPNQVQLGFISAMRSSMDRGPTLVSDGFGSQQGLPNQGSPQLLTGQAGRTSHPTPGASPPRYSLAASLEVDSLQDQYDDLERLQQEQAGLILLQQRLERQQAGLSPTAATDGGSLWRSRSFSNDGAEDSENLGLSSTARSMRPPQTEHNKDPRKTASSLPNSLTRKASRQLFPPHGGHGAGPSPSDTTPRLIGSSTLADTSPVPQPTARPMSNTGTSISGKPAQHIHVHIHSKSPRTLSPQPSFAPAAFAIHLSPSPNRSPGEQTLQGHPHVPNQAYTQVPTAGGFSLTVSSQPTQHQHQQLQTTTLFPTQAKIHTPTAGSLSLTVFSQPAQHQHQQQQQLGQLLQATSHALSS